MKRHLFIVVFLVALTVVLAAYVQSDSFALRLRPFVAGPMQEIMGPGAQVGWVRANLLPPYVEVRDIVVPYGGRAAGITIRKIKLNLSLLPLLWKKISIPSLTVLEPRIVGRRTADGRVDIAEFLQTVMDKIRKRGGTGGPSFSVDIRNITLADGSLQFVDDGTKAKMSVEKLNIRSRLRSRESLLDVRSMTGRVHAEVPAYPRIDADLNASFVLKPAALVLRNADILSSRLRLTASGSLGLDPEGPMDLKATFRAGGAPSGRVETLLKGRREGQGTTMEASMRLRGKRTSPIFDGTVRLGAISAGGLTLQDAGLRFSYRDGTIDLSGEGWKLLRKGIPVSIDRVEGRGRYDKGLVTIEYGRIRAADLTLAGEGRVDPDTGYQMTMSCTSSGNGATLSLLSGVDLKGDLSLSGALTGQIKTPRFSGTLRGGPFRVRGVEFTSVEGTLLYADRSVSIEKGTVLQGTSRYVLNGSIDLSGTAPVFHASLDAERSSVASIVALFYKQLPLDITASGSLTFAGTTSEFSGTSRLDIDAGSAYGESFDGGRLNVELSSHRVSFPEIVLRKKHGMVRGTGWIGFNGTYSARVEAAGMDLSSIDRKGTVPVAGPLALTIVSSGSFSAPIVRARAESPALSYEGYAVGQTGCDLTIAGGKLGLAVTVQGTRGVSIDLNGTMKLSAPYAWSGQGKARIADFEATSLGPVSEYLEKIRVTVDADLGLSGTVGKAGSLSGSLRASRLSVTLGGYRVQNDGDVRIRAGGGRLIIDSFVMTGEGTKLSISGSSGMGSGLDVRLNGDASLSLLRFLTRAVEHGDGIASANVRISDTWKDPNITGEVNVRNGIVKIKDVPQNFSGIAGTVSFDRNRIVTEGLRGEFGGGTITASGSAQLQNLKLLDFTSKAAVENVTVRYPAGFTATVGGMLYYDGDASMQMLSGEVNIRRARYERRVDWKSMLVDFRRGFTPRKKMGVGWIGETTLNVRFLGKDDILFQNNLANIPLELDMIIRGTVNQPQVLGHVEARKGEVYFRKNIFRIVNASADFADPNRINPALDVQAETRVREYQIRLSVTGYADHATVTFVSDPPLTDANILALLTIGRTTEDIKGKEAEVGSGEAVAFATGKFQDVLESRARSLTGLDRFQVDPYFSKDDVAVPRVTAGKELVKDRLYVTYSSNVGATTPEQSLSIEYLMNKNVSLVGGRNDIGDIGADIRFRFGFR